MQGRGRLRVCRGVRRTSGKVCSSVFRALAPTMAPLLQSSSAWKPRPGPAPRSAGHPDKAATIRDVGIPALLPNFLHKCTMGVCSPSILS